MIKIIEENNSENNKHVTVKFDIDEKSEGKSIVITVLPNNKLCKISENFYVNSHKDDILFNMSSSEIIEKRNDILFELKTLQRMSKRINEIGNRKRLGPCEKHYNKDVVFEYLFKEDYLSTFDEVEIKLYNIIRAEKDKRSIQDIITLLAKKLYSRTRNANLALSDLDNKIVYVK